MTPCQRFAQHLESEALDATDRAHAGGCRLCRALQPQSSAPGPGPSSPALERIRIAALEAARATPVRPWWREGGLLAGVNGVTALASAAALGTANWTSPAARPLRLAAAGLLLALSLTLGAVAALIPDRRRARALLWLAVVIPAALVLAGNGIATVPALGVAMHCAIWVCLSAVVPVITGLVLLRRMALDGRRALAVGLTGAAAGVFALNLGCTDGSAHHLLLFHALPWLLVAGALLLVRRRLSTLSQVP